MNAGIFAGLGRSWWVLLLYGLVTTFFGVFALLRPFQAIFALAWAFGIVALVEGVISLIALFDKNVQVSKGWLALYALASIVFGVLAVINPVATAGVLLVLLAAWLVVAGIFRIVFAIRVRKEITGEWLIALSGVLAIVLGVLFAVYPAAGLLTAAIWIGVVALIYGVLQIVASFRLRSLLKGV
ncbi:DUF308 domain-containing protein [Stenotrophomonas sp. MMGLT7]|uniref:HdeD family acid-resistance protein n=1 Tax=Stenotrophomonas sp. MMGLT7 TaxID=2901227 RepID=UPI001E3A465B|nr:DUF308 domain-containing protein [Stenotrophomonas sp. MMGLT7]MCD7100190.1 DUF308 domain-containing protein [Stenotrophomonas sp. MMGLT7]